MAASIITSVKGDVTYDGIPDTVSLIGVQFGDSNAWQQMSLVIQNGATGRITAIALPEDAAYAPSIALVSLTGKDNRDILLSLPTGGTPTAACGSPWKASSIPSAAFTPSTLTATGSSL